MSKRKTPFVAKCLPKEPNISLSLAQPQEMLHPPASSSPNRDGAVARKVSPRNKGSIAWHEERLPLNGHAAELLLILRLCYRFIKSFIILVRIRDERNILDTGSF